MWLCTWQLCCWVSAPNLASSSEEQVGTKRGVTTGCTRGEPSALQDPGLLLQGSGDQG